MIEFWRLFFAPRDPAAPPRPEIEHGNRDQKPFPGAMLIWWALGFVVAFALAGLSTPGAATTYACPATSAAAVALCGGTTAPNRTIANRDINLTEEVLQFWRADAGFVSEWP